MPFSLPCATFARIAIASLLPETISPKYDRPELRSVRLERFNGSEFCLATQAQIMAVELIGTNDGAPNEFVHINVARDFLDAVADGAKRDAVLQIVNMPGWTVASIDGATWPKNAALEGANYSKDWRLFFVEPEKRTKGAFGFNAELLARLGRASPSGLLTFPKVIDADGFVILNDSIDPDWMGVIRNLDSDEVGELRPAVIRAWGKL